ncbi:hypothetical protein VB796_21460 [Arcicella sp. LKC2W]|uniref:hypothetical protein n=1 Tax=Arcicella sp. LKC2W TaxID=2984198 RepID=UPI002B208D71|nr:hypothetical protein [Arcicella sp. LKC2W]MEA5461650.1 hypothetical protein [Arcicella sp. LKC2W]
MKNVHLILQSKGGVGKSLFTWFIAQAEKETKTSFIDLDESTQTSANRLEYIVGSNRIRHFQILNDSKRLEREKIIALFESLSKAQSPTIYIDFGASESEEFNKLLAFDIPAEILKEELTQLNINLQIIIILAGRDAFVSCYHYYEKLTQQIGDVFPTQVLLNEGTFGSKDALENVKLELANNSITFKNFGNLGDSESGKDVIKLITEGKSDNSLNLMGRITYKKAIEQIKSIIHHD